ncbi:hypothetical protein A6770_35295 [Nostoc minutum NIES-26]|uniref:Uncharacterized protein n=1 Tax=Nostoc minutum NIES-26 TaxID=1844469 RepID=A0A367S1U1_9NOSO|nr:hypothetical protein A6770_35295 [Nostoc minutum NIES-26]
MPVSQYSSLVISAVSLMVRPFEETFWFTAIGSGAIESLIRQVVNLRIKGNSKFWLKENAEIMLHLRCQWIAGSWDNFCGSIFNSFIKPQTA